MKDKCFKFPYLKLSTGFPLALKIKSKLLNMVHRSSRTWSLLTSLPRLLINDAHILFIQTGVELEIWDAYVSGIYMQIKISWGLNILLLLFLRYYNIWGEGRRHSHFLNK